MRKFIASFTAAFLLLMLLSVPARADNPVFGGIYGPAYVTTSDVLWVQTTGTPLTLTLQANYRIRQKDGSMYTNGFTCGSNVNPTSGAGCGIFVPVEGSLTFFTVVIVGGNTSVGQ